MITLSPCAQAVGQVTAELQVFQYSPITQSASVSLNIHNPAKTSRSFYGYVELSSKNSRYQVLFAPSLRFAKGTQSFKVLLPPMMLSPRSHLLIGLRLYDQETGELVLKTKKYSTQVPRLRSADRSISILLQADSRKLRKLLGRKSKALGRKNRKANQKNVPFIWQVEGTKEGWGNPLFEPLNLEGKKDVALDSLLRLKTKHRLQTGSFEQRIKLVQVRSGKSVPLRIRQVAKELQIQPLSPLGSEQDYQLVVSRGVFSTTGTKLGYEDSWGFRTTKAKPKLFEITETSPSNQEEGASVSGGVRLIFNNAPDPKSFKKDTIQLLEGDDPVLGQLRLKGKQLSFVPKKPLQFKHQYRLLVSGVRDKSGQSLDSTYQIEFTTEAAKARAKVLKVKTMYPSPKARGLGVETDVWVEFTKPLDPETLELGVLLQAGEQTVPGRWEVAKNRLKFTPESPLSYGTVYRLQLQSSLKGAGGESLHKPVSWAFKTREHMGYPKELDPNVLVFSPSHDEISYVKKRSGVLKVGITTFDPITQLDVNGKLIPVKSDTKAEFEFPYKLKARTTKFQVSVVTAQGLGQKTFVVHLGRKGDGPSFTLISILSSQQIDNIGKVGTGTVKAKATKSSLIVLPQFTYRFSSTQAVGIKALVLREKYADKTYLSREAAFNQLAFDWAWKGSYLGDLVSKVGWNDIRTDNSSLSNGKTPLISETFVGFSAKQKWGPKTSLSTSLEGKNSNAVAKAASIDNETDAVVKTLKIQAKTNFWAVSTQLSLQAVQTDAIGKYKDTSVAKGGLKFSGKVLGVSPSLTVFQKTTTYKIYNPSVSAAQKTVDQQGELKISYSLFKGLNLGVEYKHLTSSTNVGVPKYTLGTAGISFTHIW